jgi:hypothetical protein
VDSDPSAIRSVRQIVASFHPALPPGQIHCGSLDSLPWGGWLDGRRSRSDDNMTPIRIQVVLIALSITFGSLGNVGSMHRSAKDQNVSGTISSSRRMADGREWTTANLNVNASPSYCYDDTEPNCRRYGRLYTWESAQRVCRTLGDGWRLPTMTSGGRWRSAMAESATIRPT